MGDERQVVRMLDFNIRGIQERAYAGVRRAAGFLGLSERYLEGEFPRSLTLGHGIKRQFLPDPLPEGLASQLRDEWRTWVIGNALRELDQFVSLYFDETHHIVQQAKLVSGEHAPDHEWKGIDRHTNAGDKHRWVLEDANRYSGPHLEDQDCLRSLSFARNCLSHDLGIVTARRATDGALTVRWLALRTIVQQGESEVVLEASDFPIKTDETGPEARVSVRVDKKEKRFAIGEHVRLTPDDLLDICMFYQMVIDRVAAAVGDYAQECGVVFNEPSVIPHAEPATR